MGTGDSQILLLFLFRRHPICNEAVESVALLETLQTRQILHLFLCILTQSTCQTLGKEGCRVLAVAVAVAVAVVVAVVLVRVVVVVGVVAIAVAVAVVFFGDADWIPLFLCPDLGDLGSLLAWRMMVLGLQTPWPFGGPMKAQWAVGRQCFRQRSLNLNGLGEHVCNGDIRNVR